MECEDYREQLSARLDGEEDPGVAGQVDAHLQGCGDCRQWFDKAALITRKARIEPAEAGPDVAAAVLERVPIIKSSLAVRLRWALGLLGVAQCSLGLLALLVVGGGNHHHGSSFGAGLTHVSHESAAWNLALGVAFGWAALRVTHIAGLVPVLATFVTVLFGVSIADLLAGRVDPSRVSSHLLALVGLVVVVLLARLSPSGRAPLRSARGHDTPQAPPGDGPRQPRARFGHRGQARATGDRAA